MVTHLIGSHLTPIADVMAIRLIINFTNVKIIPEYFFTINRKKYPLNLVSHLKHIVAYQAHPALGKQAKYWPEFFNF